MTAAITPDTPLRLAKAAQLAFPDGSITEKSLRREAARGHLDIERIAGKDFTTLAAIERMRTLCRVLPSPRASTSERAAAETPSSSSATAQARSALAMAQTARQMLKRRSPHGSPPATSQAGATVIPLVSRSQTS